MGSLVTGYDRKKLSHGVAPAARNVRYGLNYVATRFGLAPAIQLPEQCNINGLGALVRVGLSSPYVPLVFSDTGNLYKESPVGTSLVVKLQPSITSLPVSAYMEMVAAYQRAYLAFNNLETGACDGQVYDGTNLDPHTQRPVGETWQPSTAYIVGEIVTPTIANKHMYRCITAGTSGGTEPVWPLTAQRPVSDPLAYTADAPTLQIPYASFTGGGALPAGLDIYFIMTLSSAFGEGLPTAPLIADTNTTLNDEVLIFAPVLTAAQIALGARAPTDFNVYIASVATGGAVPAVSAFRRYATNPIVAGGITVTALTPVTVAPPTTITPQAGGVVWQEANIIATNQLPVPPAPFMALFAGSGAFPAGRDVYVLFTFNNGLGETLPGPAASLLNTTLNSAVYVMPPLAPPGFAGLPAPFALTTYNIYEADVAHLAAAPATAAFRKVAGGPFPLTTPVIITAAAAGVAPPVSNTANVAPAGNVTSGLRYFGVLFVNRQGNVSGFTRASAQFINITTSNLEFFLANIPTGPTPTTAQRILVFGLPGATQNLVSTSGPYLYIAADDASTGENILTTVINDNTTTTAYFNFTDSYLQDSVDATDFLRAIKLPPQAAVRSIVALHRLATIGEVGQPSLVRFSEADMPGTFYGDTGFMYIKRDDGQKLYGIGEFKNQIYAAKERGGFVLNTSTSEPASWGATPVWSGNGPSGFEAIDFGSDFIAYANESGAWIYQGQDPDEITLELSDSATGLNATRDAWEAINWNGAGNTVIVSIDEQEKEVRFAVPMLDATVPNKVFTVSYRQGWGEPIVFSSYAGKLVSHPDSRKWSIDDIQGNRIVRVYRPLNPLQIKDHKLAKTQVLVGSNQDDGMVYMIQPDTYDDNGLGIDSYYETALVGVDDLEIPGMTGGLARLGGFVASLEGNGKLWPVAVDYKGRRTEWERPIEIVEDPSFYYRRYANATSRKWSIGISNHKVAGVWFKLFEIDVYLQQYKVQEQPVMDART